MKPSTNERRNVSKKPFRKLLIRPQLVMACSQSSAKTEKIITILLSNIFTPTRKRLEFKHATWKTQIHEGRRGYIHSGSREYTLDGANIFTVMKHKVLRHTHELRHDAYYNVVLRWRPSIHRFKKCMMGWEAAKHQGSSRLQTSQGQNCLLRREQCIIVIKSLLLWA